MIIHFVLYVHVLFLIVFVACSFISILHSTHRIYKCLTELIVGLQLPYSFVYGHVSGFQDSLKGMGSTEPNWIWVCKYCSDV